MTTDTDRIAARFWDKVDMSGECWVWTAATNRNGYGVFSGRTRLAHRMAWKEVNGAIPRGLFVCHHCDNPPCVRPEHLFLGTCADNVRDMLLKGRAKRYEGPFIQPPPENRARGERVGGAILTEEQVAYIRNAYEPRKYTAPRLASEFGVSIHNIKRIVQGRTWKHV